MKIVDRYLIHEYLRNLLFITFSFVALFLIIDFFEKLRMFLSNHATFGQVGAYFLFMMPMIISQILPAAILLSSLMTCGYLSRHSEITAMKANGISLYRIALPILTIAALTSLLIFFLGEWVTPHTNDKAKNIILIEVQKQPSMGSFKQDQIWYRGQKGIYNFRLFDARTGTLQGITIHYLDRQMNLIMRLDAERGEWKEGHWLFHNLLVTRFDSGEFPVLSKMKQQVVDLPERPSDFQLIQKDVEIRRRSPRQDRISVGQHPAGHNRHLLFSPVRAERRHRPGNRRRADHRIFLLACLRLRDVPGAVRQPSSVHCRLACQHPIHRRFPCSRSAGEDLTPSSIFFNTGNSPA
jgi:lipopolysaccharide export LptBFGC system permease protein LptF